jgi:hypothetical protein
VNFAKDKTYKITETPGAIVITAHDITVKDPAAKPLCLGTAGHVLTYLDRYFYERERGNTQRDSHHKACETAKLPIIGAAPESNKPS